jgi:hypothetical protein
MPPNVRSLNAAKAQPLISDFAKALLRLAACHVIGSSYFNHHTIHYYIKQTSWLL